MSNPKIASLARLKLLSCAILGAIQEENWQETQILLAERALILNELAHDPQVPAEQIAEILKVDEKSITEGRKSMNLVQAKLKASKRMGKAPQAYLGSGNSPRIDRSS